MSVVETYSPVRKLEESIKKLVEYKFPMDEVEQATILNDCDNVLEEFVAFKKDYDNEIHVPKRLFKDGKYVERIKVLLSDYVIVSRKKLEDWLEAEKKLDAKEQSIAENVLKKILGIEPL